MSGYRLGSGGRVARDSAITFRFDEQNYHGFAGDTLASALLANGVRLMGRSFKYHRPRGVMTAAPEEPSALVELGEGAKRSPNTPATMIELRNGLVAASQNRWPSLSFDFMSIGGAFARFLPAGFYYKTFMWPASFWEKLYEPAIRRAAGLGRIADGADPDHYHHVHRHCDILIVGSGAAGLAAAREASASGARVILAEQDFELGGGLLVEPGMADDLKAQIAALASRDNLEILTRTTVVAAYDHGVFAAIERSVEDTGARERLHLIRARRAIFATGAIERLIAFPGNDRPGVMLASAARAYCNRWGVAVGQRVALFAANDDAYATARDLAEAGVEIVAIIDPRTDSAAAGEAVKAGLTVMPGCEVSGVDAGRDGVRAIRVRRRNGAPVATVIADALCVSGGFSPHAHLASQAQTPLVWRNDISAFAPGEETGLTRSAGAARGIFGVARAAANGADIGRAVAASLGFAASVASAPEEKTVPAANTFPLWEVRADGKSFVDLQNDVTADDIRLAHREGYTHVEHAKRYTTHGMATDQGKIGGLVGSAVLADARGEPIAKVGLSRMRPYAQPATWGALAGADVGAHFKPKRRLPLHDWHARNGAVFTNIGIWLRPLVYSPAGDTSWGPVLDEARAARRSVGVTDMSSLGKIDVQGPDAATFLDRIYANTFSTLPVGRARYGIMLREDGMMLDDGTTSRLAHDHFLVTATTQKAPDVLEHMEWHLATVWRDLDVTLTNVADHWAQFAVAGPNARRVVERIVKADMSNEAAPFMAVGEADIAGVPGRWFRISFSGELAYEVAVPACHAEHAWTAILEAGKEFEIRPYALDALNVMRIEKGHVTGGEINGQTTAADLGFGRMLKKSGDFVGGALSQRPGLLDPARLQLVGLAPVDVTKRLRGGAHFVGLDGKAPSQGYVTAACMACEGEGWIGLGLLSGGHARHGERVIAASPVFDEFIEVVIGSPHRVDPENLRVRA
ncbi:sarcosine oxidase subunit alpha family protein [Terrarubrum flagellatum]|uniref:sarcosine oxidase subunit alpha family protein n=1 Tax=Terrirubrum flagellatum TaxID=2895980 RepID=UPI00314569CE